MSKVHPPDVSPSQEVELIGDFRGALEDIPTIDSEYVQFGSPGWFWGRHPNTYALQVEPERFMRRDEAVIEHREALHVQRVRDQFFERLRQLVDASQQEVGAG